MNDYIERKSIRNLYSCLNPNDRVRAEQVVTDIDAIPSADAVSLEEFEQMRFLADKSMEMLGEERPKGEWKHLKGDEWLCSNCGYVVWTEGSWEHPLERGKDYCEHCGANMTMKGADDE